MALYFSPFFFDHPVYIIERCIINTYQILFAHLLLGELTTPVTIWESSTIAGAQSRGSREMSHSQCPFSTMLDASVRTTRLCPSLKQFNISIWIKLEFKYVFSVKGKALILALRESTYLLILKYMAIKQEIMLL